VGAASPGLLDAVVQLVSTPSLDDWKQLLTAIKADCLVGLWAKGTELARAGCVSGQERGEDGWTFRVRAPGHTVAPTVRLFPTDREWECDCDGAFDPCEHVAACAIATAAAPDAVDALFAAATRSGGIRYELASGAEGLTLRRYVIDARGGAQLLEQSLADLVARRGAEETFSPTHADLAVDRLLRYAPPGPFSFDNAVALLRALVGADDVRLDGVPVRTSGEPLYPRARAVDAAAGGVELVIEAALDVTRIVAPGVLLRGETLHPFGAQARFGRSWERLPFRRVFPLSELSELVSTVLPELERHIPVQVATTRLPKREGALSPWIRFEIDFVDHGIDVLPSLVYGDPPQARVDGDRLVHLKGGVPTRQPDAETNLLLRLRHDLNLVPGRRVHFDAADAARFLTQLESFADGRPDAERLRRAATQRRVGLVPRLVRTKDELELVFEAADAHGKDKHVARSAAAAVVAAWRDGIGLVPLDDGRFAAVPADWLARYGDLVADLLAAREASDGRTPAAALPLVGELCDALDSPPPVELARVRSLLDGLTTAAVSPANREVAVALPAGFRGELRGYQAAGVAWLAQLRDAGLGAVLADDMGLGKTIQALCVLSGRTLVVCPRSVIHNWAKEIERFRPDLRVSLYHGSSRTLTDADVTLTTYATLRNDVDALADVEWSCVVLDEAQAIKNPDSQVARAAYELRAAFRLSLSGTPIENRLDELWSQMHFSNRGLLGGRRDFVERYERPMLAGDAAVTERLRRRIRPFVLRRLKREVATELPPRTDAILYCELDAEERRIYDAVRLAARADVVRQISEGTSIMAMFEALLRLRQAACHAGLLPGSHAETSSKVEALCDALEDAVADGHKALVFSQWTSLLDRVEPQLASRTIAFTRLDGSTRDRGAVVDKFQDPAGPPVLLISLKAGGTGLNLTAADHVFLLDPWWNPAVEEQAADRAHRIGQDRPVMVYRLVAKDTVEERVLDLQRRKRQIADAALAGAEQAGSAGVTREDLLALLN
jgi:superfamily II DNA or RNA helicase